MADVQVKDERKPSGEDQSEGRTQEQGHTDGAADHGERHRVAGVAVRALDNELPGRCERKRGAAPAEEEGETPEIDQRSWSKDDEPENLQGATWAAGAAA